MLVVSPKNPQGLTSGRINRWPLWNRHSLNLAGRNRIVRRIAVLYLVVKNSLRNCRDRHTAPTRARYSADSRFHSACAFRRELERHYWHCCRRSQTLFLPARAVELSRTPVLHIPELDHHVIYRQSRGRRQLDRNRWKGRPHAEFGRGNCGNLSRKIKT